MNAFIIELENTPGALAKVTAAIAERGIDITSFSGATCGTSGTVCLLTNDEAGTRRALQDGGFTSHEIEVVPAALVNKPGSLAAAARKLAAAGVNIEAALPTGMSGSNVVVEFATSDPARARSALGELVAAAAGQ